MQLQNTEMLAQKEIAWIDKEFVPIFGRKNPEDFLLKGFSNHVIVKNSSWWHLMDLSGMTILSLKYEDIPLGLILWTHNIDGQGWGDTLHLLILRDKTMADKLMYISNNDTQNNTFFRLKLVVETFKHSA